jgi:hypothetical protein
MVTASGWVLSPSPRSAAYILRLSTKPAVHRNSDLFAELFDFQRMQVVGSPAQALQQLAFAVNDTIQSHLLLEGIPLRCV